MRRRGLGKPCRRYPVTVVLAVAGSLVVSTGCGSPRPRPTGAGGTSAAGAAATPSSAYVDNELYAVSAVSSTDAWAVGYSGLSSTSSDDTLTLHWNGTRWAKVTSPSPLPGQTNQLHGVSAVSANDAWAVGYFGRNAASSDDTLILHWNGTRWAMVTSPSPLPGQANRLHGVSAVSANDAWAVGETSASDASKPLILHWNGKAWSPVKVSSSSRDAAQLRGVTAISASDAWAVGSYYIDKTKKYDTLIMHWNGSRWSEVSSPDPDAMGENRLNAVSADGANDVWAVGKVCPTVGERCTFKESTLILHWNGKAWSRVPSPSPSKSDNFLNGVSADPASANDAWAVGWYATPSFYFDALTLRWNGTRWSQVTAPDPSTRVNFLIAVSTVSQSDALAVGLYVGRRYFATLGLRWNGTEWVRP